MVATPSQPCSSQLRDQGLQQSIISLVACLSGLIDGSGLAATLNAAAPLADALSRAGIPPMNSDSCARVVTARSLRDALVSVEDGALSAAILDHALSDATVRS